MKFVCDRCQTKYSIADEKVRGKVLKVRCKTCANVITVREAAASASSGRQSVPSMAPVRPSSSSLAPVRGSSAAPARSRSAAHASVGIEDADDDFAGISEDERERTVIAPAPAGFMAEVAAARKPALPAAAPGLTEADGVQWFFALDGKQTGPFSRKALVDKVIALPKDADVHVWNELLDGWKEPLDVPELARDIAARRKSAPPPAPKAAGPPRPPTPASPLAPTGAPPRGRPYPAGAPPSSAALSSPALSGPRLAPPTSAPVRLSGSHAVSEEIALPTPDALPPPRTSRPTNGIGLATVRAATPAAPLPTAESDALNALNLATVAPAPAAEASGARNGQQAAAPRLVSASAMMGLDVSAPVPVAAQGRHRSAKLILGFLGLVGVVCSVILFNVFKKPSGAGTAAVAKPTQGESQFGSLADQVAQEKAQPGEAPAPEEPAPAAKAKATPTKLRVQARPARGSAGGHVETPATTTAPAPEDASAARFRETGGRAMDVPKGGGVERRPPSQEEISRVISNNKAGIKTCYQRALLRDSTLTHGKITVKVSIGLSGRVKSVGVDGPMQFRALEPCIREMLSRWAFPPASEEYGTEFSYLFQGNE